MVVGAVGGGEGEGVVGVAGDGPSVVEHFVVFVAEQGAVGSGGGAAIGAVDDVVYFGVPGGGVAAGFTAALVALLDGGA